ncbi:hypothetical protein GGD55_006274 [Rhizobium giardinii]|uniref:Uncharacterized protein n=1 Tax=Rhizobium giardinii TaxID=56731 RepID=A0A7W8XBR2_9HYPH|nr:hypothetical protein [Rhizobium giardinii]
MCDFTVDVAAIAGRHGFYPELVLENNRSWTSCLARVLFLWPEVQFA